MNVLGIDPSDPTCPDPKSGWGLISVNGRKLQALACGVLDPGHECDEFESLLVRHAVDVVGVEWAMEVYQDGPEARKSAKAARIAITRALLRQNILAGRLLRAAESRVPGKVHGIEAPRWRKVIGVRQSKSETTDAAVKRAIRMHLANWPDQSNAHERDGAGVAIAIGLGAR
jgi:hypothetical protein